MSADARNVQPVLTITDGAREKVLYLRSRDREPERLALRLAVSGVARGEYTYDMTLQYLDSAQPGDLVQHHDDLAVIIPADSVDKLRGSTLYLEGDVTYGGIRLHNPNSPSPAVGTRPVADLSGDVAQRVLQVLERQINPSIASHGGAAELVAVEDGVAYLRLSGGCQGCGMATVTLTQGIEVAIRESVPEITRVADVTDHASGTNPYFESAKK
jgi:Fe/S biogenesis protein NfuA